MGEPRLSRGARSDSPSKLDPLLVESLSVLRKALLGQAVGVVSTREELFTKIEELRKRFPDRKPGPPLPVDIIYLSTGTEPLSPNETAKGVLAWMHWNRFRTPLWQDSIRADRGDIAASKRITATTADYDQRRSTKNWQPKFKIDIDHAAMFELGFGLGVESLTQSELGDFFDGRCICGRRSHSPYVLRRQRNRFASDLRRALWWEHEMRRLIVGETLVQIRRARP